MKYKGIEQKEVTEQQIFNPPKLMLVWNDITDIVELNVYAIVNRKDYPVICKNSNWRHCAEIPEAPEQKPVTHRELARWVAEGNGEIKNENSVCPNWNYWVEKENKAISDRLLVRKWDETEWHKPTRDYLGLEDK